MKAKMVYIVAALVLVFSLVAVFVPAGPASAQIFNIADGDVTGLINAINTANNNGEPDTINLAVNGTYTLNSSDNNTDGPNGLPSINSSITINGNGATIQRDSAGGTPNFRIFHVADIGNISMSDLTIRNGNVTGTDHGGGIYNYGTLEMTGCTVSGNEAEDGGGIGNDGSLTMNNCTVIGNKAQNDEGGGIWNHNDRNVDLTECTVTDNYASADGGSIYNNEGFVTLTNCTISGNTVGDEGGGIYNYYGDLTLTNCTISDNDADDGGGIYNNTDSIVTLRCTVVYDNTAGGSGDDIYNSATITDSTGESIVGDAVGYPDGGPDPLLGPLQNNGGTTNTSALGDGSPAIDACVNGCTVDTDQRGVTRPQGSACDVGAYEYQQQPTTPPVGGIVEPVGRISILAPWLGLAAIIVVASAAIVLLKRIRIE